MVDGLAGCTLCVNTHRCFVSGVSQAGSGSDTSTGTDTSSSSSEGAPSSATGAPPADMLAMRSRSRAILLHALAKDTWGGWMQQQAVIIAMRSDAVHRSVDTGKAQRN
mgnify:CR=1 FL=1